MLRRTMILAAGSAAASCAREQIAAVLATQVPSAAPPPTKITRLLLWLPADDQALDAKVVAERFTTELASVGAVVAVGRAKPSRLDRRGDQQPFIATFKPTHRLEIEARRTGSRDSMTLTPSTVGLIFTVNGVLYPGDGTEPLRMFEYGPMTGRTSVTGPKLVDAVVAKLKLDGYLQDLARQQP
jgi:hypothetical protein